MNHPDPSRRLLDDLEALANLPIDAEAAGRAVERARAAAEATARAPRSRRIVSLPRLGAAAALAALVLLAVWFAPWHRGEGVAFAQVIAQLDKAKTVQYMQTRKDTDKNNRVGPIETRKVMILDRYRKREEIKTTAGDKLPKGQVWTTADSDYVMIQNAETGKM
ncbi:MAG TPA: hypothetical protein VMF30_14700, partial [Pirellulales bacterium]|nr:hypothetical protein [Pirellulales bacterium]